MRIKFSRLGTFQVLYTYIQMCFQYLFQYIPPTEGERPDLRTVEGQIYDYDPKNAKMHLFWFSESDVISMVGFCKQTKISLSKPTFTSSHLVRSSLSSYWVIWLSGTSRKLKMFRRIIRCAPRQDNTRNFFYFFCINLPDLDISKKTTKRI